MIEIKNASKTFQKNKAAEFKALDNISLNIGKGELIAIIGKSGAGKTTLLHNIACIDSFDEGTVFLIDGTDVTSLNDEEKAKLRSKNIGLVFQDFALVPEFTVFENVEIPLVLAREKRKSRRVKVMEALSKVGLEKYAHKDVTNLSGGEKQRVAIARAIVNNPDIILADEPTGALDTKTGEVIFDLLKTLSDSGKTVIIVTHDKDIARKCERVIEISDGKILN